MHLILGSEPLSSIPADGHPLREYPKLTQVFRQVVIKNKPVALDAESAFKLDSMGLVTLQGNDVTPRCDLYRYYFRAHLGN